MRILFLIVMLLAQSAQAAEGSQNLSTFFDPTPAASEKNRPAQAQLPDLSKAPKWRDIAATPEFQALPPAKQFEAKVAYFDYWIAPHVIADGRISDFAEVRAEFLRQLDATSAKQQPGTIVSDEQVFGKQQSGTKTPENWWESSPLARDDGVFDPHTARLLEESIWGHFAWPHYVVLAAAIIGLIVLIRMLRTRMPSPAIPPKADASAGGSRMNNRQRKILIAVAALIALMLLYPPYQLHTGAGMGYSWLFSPPEYGYSVHAVINASQLLVQWVAVLLIGGIAFALSGQANVVTTMNPAAAPTPTPETITSAPQTTPTNSSFARLYEAVIGEKSRAYYLTKFEAFDQASPGLRPGWNWAAFLVGGVWALYRKMYGWFFAFWGVELVTQLAFKVFLKLGSPGVGLFLFSCCGLLSAFTPMRCITAT